jgi:hypothetical protein
MTTVPQFQKGKNDPLRRLFASRSHPLSPTLFTLVTLPGLHEPTYAAVLLGLILPQMFAQYKYLIPDPIANDVKYQAAAQPWLVGGLLTTGLAYGAHVNAAIPL